VTVCCATQSRLSLDRASPQACDLNFNYVGEDPVCHGDNVAYMCRSLRLTPFRLQHNRPAADPGLRCAYSRNYHITFAPEEPWRSQVQNPVFSSRSSDI